MKTARRVSYNLSPVVLVSAVLAAGLSASGAQGADGVVSIQLPPESATFKAGPGEDLARARCLICHSADYVYTQPPLPAAKWKAGVEKMRKVFGCPIPDADVDALAKYLTAQNGPQELAPTD